MERSFGREVLSTAWTNSRTLLRSRLQSTVTALLSFSVGVCVQLALGGLSASPASLLISAASAIAVALILFGGKFAWHLFLAPTEILLDAILPILESAETNGIALPTNYSIWKWKQKYTASEFAALLDGFDPSSLPRTANSRSYLQLILDDLNAGELKYIRPPWISPDITYNIDIGTWIAKEEALSWGEKRGFAAVLSPLRE